MTQASVVPFPLCRRRKLVDSLACELREKQGADADVFWKATAKQLLRQLVTTGVSLEAAQCEVRSLLSVVVRELRRDPANNQQRG